MLTLGEWKKDWKGFGADGIRVAILTYRSYLRDRKKHQQLWAQLIIRKHTSGYKANTGYTLRMLRKR